MPADAVPPSNPPTSFPDDYANLDAVNGNDVITTNESSVTVSGISDGLGASIVTYLVPYEESAGEPDSGSTIISESNTVTVTDLDSTDANGNEIGTYSATLPTTGLAPGIYVAESYLEFPNGGNTVYENSGAGSKQIVSVEAPATQTLPAQIELSGTNAEITTDGQFLVYTAISEYNEPEITGDVYERNLQTGAEVDLTATGQSPTGVFAVNHTPTYAAGSSGDYLSYPSFTSANGAETFSTINDFDLNPDGGGYNPLPVVTNSAGVQSVIGGIGANKFDVGAATAVSDDGSVVLSVETNEVQYGATGASFLNMADPQIYVSYLGAAASGPDVFSDSLATSSGQFLWSNAGNWSEGIPGNAGTVSLAGSGIDDLAALSLSTLISNGKVTSVDGAMLAVSTLVADSASGLVADSTVAGGSATVSVLLGTVTGSGGLFVADGAQVSIEILGPGLPAEIYQAEAGGRIILDSLSSGSKFGFVEAGTLALVSPGLTTAATIAGLDIGDVLELPGTAVSHIDFGNTLDSVTTLSVTTSSGIYVFTEAGISGVHGYTLSQDASTGLEAITFTSTANPTGPDVFSDSEATSSGQFLWSNAGNWSEGIPGNAGSVSLAGSGMDDLAALSLATLISNGEVASVDGGLLSISTLVADSASGLVADSTIAGGSATVSVLLGTVTGSGGLFVADGARASIEILSAGLPDEIYQAEAGGRIILDSLSAGSKFGFVDAGTLALARPGASTSATIAGLGIGDVLELPGTAVSAVEFGATSLAITTNSGTYDFTNVGMGAGVGAYTADLDPATGLEAVTLAAALQFQGKSEYQGIEPLDGVYLWKDAGNWVAGAVPRNGDIVVDTGLGATDGIDDIDNLSLSGLTLGSGNALDLIGETLALGNLLNQGILVAQGGVADPDVTIVVNGVTEPASDPGLIFADGQGAVVIDNVAINTGELIADGGGMVEINVAPGAAALNYDGVVFGYFNGPAGFALSHPGATITTALMNLEREDVLELPGNAVSAVHFGTASLTIATSAGTYDFTNVSYEGSVTGYTASLDAATGLEAITFTGAPDPTVDVFDGNTDHGDFMTLTGELWSTDDNWEDKVPRNGDAVQISTTGYLNLDGQELEDTGVDDISTLSLSSMSVLADGLLLVAASLTVGSLSLVPGGIVGSQDLLVVQGNTENDGEIDADGLNGDGLATTVVFDGAVNGSGIVRLETGYVACHGSIGAGQTIAFTDGGVLALYNPGSLIAAHIEDMKPGNVIELPGTAVLGIDFETGAMQVTTSSGIYDFTSVSDSSPVFGYAASHDASTGLEAINFVAADVFFDDAGDSGWSNAANWSEGVPADGDAVVISAGGFLGTDDIPQLSISSLSIATGSGFVLQPSLEIPDGSTSNTLTIGSILGSGELTVGDGGKAVIVGAVSSTTSLTDQTGGTIALAAAVAGTGDALGGAGLEVQGGSVLELPGSLVAAFNVGASSLTITTDKGVFDFGNIEYAPGAQIAGYTASRDSATGLEAVTLVSADVFFSDAGDSGWSNAANWSEGVPADGDAVVISAGGFLGTDDIPQLSISSLSIATGSGFVLQPSLEIPDGSTSNTLTIGSILGSGELTVGDGGKAVIVGAVSSTTSLTDQTGGTIALAAAVAGTGDVLGGAGLEVEGGSVLELPGSLVAAFNVGASSLTITTDKGVFDFGNVEYAPGAQIAGYTTSRDSATGLEAVTLVSADVFFDDAGDSGWSNAANWSEGVPADGDAVVISAGGFLGTDDIPQLSISSLSIATGSGFVLQPSLEIPDGSTSNTLTIGSILGSGELTVGDGGKAVIVGAVSSTTSLTDQTGGTIALAAAVAGTGDVLGGAGLEVEGGSVLELPGSLVAAFNVGASSLTITTDKGVFDFGNVEYAPGAQIAGYTTSRDSATGLEAVTLVSADVFFDAAVAADGTYLWSNATNWSDGVPTDGISVSIAAAGTDDIANLSLNSLSVTAAEFTVNDKLTVGDLYVAAGAEVNDLGGLDVTGGTVDDGVISTDPSVLTFDGAVTGSGTIDIGADSDVIFAGSVAASETLQFLSSTGTLTIDDPSGFAAKVVGSGVTIVNGVTLAAPADAKPSLGSDGGTLTAGPAADEFTLNLGSVTQGGAALSAVLDLTNAASAPADPLGSSFSLTGTSFDDTGFTNLTGIAAGATVIAGSISLQTGIAGTFSETIVLSPVETEGNGTTLALAKETVNVTGIVTPRTGSAQGDVHLVTFDGLHYNFQATGDFVLARSTVPGDLFQVQMQAMPYRQIAGTSVADAYAAQLGNDRIAFTAGANGSIGVSVNGIVDTAISHAGARQIFSGGTLVATAANKFVLEWNSGESMAVTAEIPLGQTYLDASISLPSKDGPGSVQGLMGSDSGQANDFALADGTILKNPSASEILGAFADSWRVTSETSILGDVIPVTAVSLISPSLSTMAFETAATPQNAATTGKILTGAAASSQFGQALTWGALTGGSADPVMNSGVKDATGAMNLESAAYGGSTSILPSIIAKPHSILVANDAHGMRLI